MLISKFKNKSVCDLAWAISTPPIIQPESQSCVWPTSFWFENVYQETLAWFNELDQDASELDILIEKQKDKRLGKYFETLWFYWFSHHPQYEVLAQNLQIVIAGETLGEIDFILYDKKNKKVMHWEVAVKFYLGLGDTRQMQHWYGPNLRDRLDIKVNHLVNKQSRISNNPEVANFLHQLGFTIEQCAVVLKGRLYYHNVQSGDDKAEHNETKNNSKKISFKVNAGAADIVLSPEYSVIDHLRGKWFRQSEFAKCFADDQCFAPLLNSGWLQSLPTDGIAETVSKRELLKTLSKNELRLPLHLQVFKGDEAADKIFLVNENWSKSD